MKRLLVLGFALVGLSGCVSDYPVYDDYPVYEPRPRIYDARPVVVYEDRYRPRPVYRPGRDPYWRDDRRFGRYDRPRYREDRRFYDGPRDRGPRYDRPDRPRFDRPAPPPPRIAESPPVRNPRLDPPPPRAVEGGQPGIDVGRAFGGRAVPAAGGPPRPYIPPQPAN
ncbi:hypothetical protein [Aureimonas sp. SK2]|uniref:hypothetical protein n=1 Tax=Aureimonas sp. SK2 TaxID=3015992 RepID=UPI00244531E7|nr:hypothetical protein [Aureimonas sp. SK2]